MDDLILDEVRHDVFERPKPTIDLDYLFSVKRQVQELANGTNDKLKKNVYQNYSLFIESSREISTLKEEMRQLNMMLEQQQSAMNKLLEQLTETPIVQPTLERPKAESFRLEMTEEPSEVEAETLPAWFTKCPEDFDVLIAQRNLREAVELAKKVASHLEQYPKCCDNKVSDLKIKIDSRLQELTNVICSELQPATDRTLQGGPRSSVAAIRLLRELNFTSKAVKLYLDQRSSVLRFVLGQQKVESTTSMQFIKQICSIFFHHTIETCNEFKQAFEVERQVSKAVEESVDNLGLDINGQESNQMLLFDLVRPIYYSSHDDGGEKCSQAATSNGSHDMSSHILSQQAAVRFVENTLIAGKCRTSNVFYNLSTYSCLTYWTVSEFESFISMFRQHVFNNPNLSTSMVAESIYHLRSKCSKMAMYCEIDMCHLIEKRLESETRRLIEDSGRKLIEIIQKLNAEEQWQPQQFVNKAQMTRFFEEMSDVELKTMPSYIYEDLKLRFTACKTSFARHFLITVNDLSKLVNPLNRDHIEKVLVKVFEMEMESVVEALKKVKVASKVRFIMGNSNFLLDKVIVVADAQYTKTTGTKCQRLIDLRAKYQAKVKSVANM